MHVKCKYVVGVLAGKIQHLRSFWGVCYHYIMMHYCVLVPFTRTVNCSEIMHWLLRPELCNLCSSLRPETGMAANPAVGVCPAGAGYCLKAHPGWCMPCRMTSGCAFKMSVWLSPAGILSEDVGTCTVQAACLRRARWSCVWYPRVLCYRHSLSPTRWGGKAAFNVRKE